MIIIPNLLIEFKMDHKAFLEKQELFLKFVEITSDITKREKLQTFRN